jgi:hypothetical protein
LNENELYLKARKLGEDFPDVSLHCEVADVRESSRLNRLAHRTHPQYVFHAAAHKHVPLMEDAPEEAVKNNVFGTLNVARKAHDCGAERLVVISTDKAVKPTSVMGATKRIAELVTRQLARSSKTHTEDEEQTQQVRNRIRVAKSPPPPHDLDERLRELKVLADAGEREPLLRGIERLVPTYRRTPNRPLQIVPEPTPEMALTPVVQLRVAAKG